MGATTGNAEVDKIVRENFTEAIGIAYQIITDMAPEIDQPRRDRMSAVIVAQVFPAMAKVITQGVRLLAQAESEEEDAQGQDQAT